jgi:hypothetical protein
MPTRGSLAAVCSRQLQCHGRWQGQGAPPWLLSVSWCLRTPPVYRADQSRSSSRYGSSTEPHESGCTATNSTPPCQATRRCAGTDHTQPSSCTRVEVCSALSKKGVNAKLEAVVISCIYLPGAVRLWTHTCWQPPLPRHYSSRHCAVQQLSAAAVCAMCLHDCCCSRCNGHILRHLHGPMGANILLILPCRVIAAVTVAAADQRLWR